MSDSCPCPPNSYQVRAWEISTSDTVLIQWDNLNDCNQHHKDYISCETIVRILKLMEGILIIRL